MVSFKALKNSLFCLISHCDHVSIETIMFVLSTDMCASIKGTQLPNVSCGSGGSGFLHHSHRGFCRKCQKTSRWLFLSMKRDTGVRPRIQGV